ncbi:MAG: aspartate--tRNA ligase [bacterium]
MQASTLATSFRTHPCGDLRPEHVGQAVRLGGWVHRSRDLGGLVFLDLRDRAGLVQVSFDPGTAGADVCARAAAVGSETVVLIEGVVAERPVAMRNADMNTGAIEVRATALRIVGPASTPAIPVARGKNELLAAEELRLRHRYLDLRRDDLQRNLMLRHRLLQRSRRFLSDAGFLEIETPILTKPTPEGARDYLVPSRVHAGEFYALPQSPQIYKQLLMISGFDRYFQIARCFRDEDLRADRQPEFTQIDIEASFVAQADIVDLAESLIGALWQEGESPFPTERVQRMAYADAMEQYGIDRPDLRYGLVIDDVSSVFRDTEFVVTKSALDAGGRVRGIRVPGGAALSRKQVDEIEAVAKGAGAMGLLRLKRVNGVLEGPAAKFLAEGAVDALGLAEGELGLYVAALDRISNPALDKVRQDVAQRMQLVPANVNAFVWVTDFPMFEQSETGELAAMHHPFTAPNPDDVALLESAPHKARALAYDLVLNGTELGGGSIRISDPAVQSRIFTLLGIDEETAQARFGFLLEGLRAGAPPHGGIAFGFDRITMLLAGVSSLRDVIAFPKTTAARALFEGAPSPVPANDLRDLHIKLESERA